jgi:hypothetical protein
MKRVSDKKQEWLDKYHAQIEKDAVRQVCAVCGTVGTKNSLERHHPRRRLGKNILIYEYVCGIPCHVEIENGEHPEHLPRDNDHEKNFHALKDGDNMLKNNEE